MNKGIEAAIGVTLIALLGLGLVVAYVLLR